MSSDIELPDGLTGGATTIPRVVASTEPAETTNAADGDDLRLLEHPALERTKAQQ